jgi:DNA-binding cell septation regulator SpoVG
MEITKVKIILVKSGAMLASANVTFDNCFVINDFQVVQGPNGLSPRVELMNRAAR